jgi:2-oxoglutarate ferredoxin oxidoreductase subunit delta
MRGTIIVDEDRCKGCELCEAVCPKGIIVMADSFTSRGYHPARLVDSIFVDARGQCTGCLLCAVVCPEAAITVFREASARMKNAALA